MSLDCFTLIGLLRKKASWHPPSLPLTCFHFARGLLPASRASLCNMTAPSQGVWLPMQKQCIKTNKAYKKAGISTAPQPPGRTRQSSPVFHGSLPVCPAIQHHLYGRPPLLSSYGTTEEVITDFAEYRISGDGHLP